MFLQPVNIVQCIFVFVAAFSLLLIRRNQPFSDLKYLAALLTLSMSFNLLEELNITRNLYLVTPIFVLAKGPAFYLFVRRVVFPQQQNQSYAVLHFIPALAALPFTAWPQAVIAVGTISQLIYAYFTLKAIRQYHLASSEMRSDASNLSLNWVVAVFLVYLALGVFDLVRLNLQPYITTDFNLDGQLIGTLLGLLLFCYLVYKAVATLNVFANTQQYIEQIQPALSPSKQPIQPTQPTELEKNLFEQIHQHIVGNQLHRKAKLSLNDIAADLGLNLRDVSRAINLCAGCNFNDFINKMRVEDIKHQLNQRDDDSMNLLDLAFATGFNSKSNFNAVFKKQTGMTPSQYLKSLQG